jgi:hypothetical protein
MPYDLFISYARHDNEREQVTALNSQIESSFRAFAGRELGVFFDTQEIAGMDDWRHKIQRSLRDSQVFLAVLSPHYVVSPCCRHDTKFKQRSKRSARTDHGLGNTSGPEHHP